jgi:hypothetical protein
VSGRGWLDVVDALVIASTVALVLVTMLTPVVGLVRSCM